MPFGLPPLSGLLGKLPLGWLSKVRPGTPAAAELTHEKVRGSIAFSGNQVRFLPWIDGSTIEETTEMRLAYRQMLKEPAVKAAFWKKILSVAQLDIQIHPASDSPADKLVADFVHDVLTGCAGGTRRIVTNILAGALMDGFSVCEKVWRVQDRGRWRGKVVLKAVKAKDTQWLELLGDTYRNVLYVRDLRTSTCYPIDNFVHYAHQSLFETPLGQSDFRAAYRAYFIMQTAWQLRAIAMERYSLPMMKGTYKRGQDDLRDAIEQALEQARGQGWISLPEGAAVEVINLAAKWEADFQAAIRDLQADMVLAIEGATLQMLQGTVADGRGNSQVHQQGAEILAWYLSAEAAEVIKAQLIPTIVDLNFAGADYPTATLSSVNDADLANSLAVDKGLLDMGLPLSRKATYEKYSRQPPADPTDVLTAQPAAAPSWPGGLAGGGGGQPPRGVQTSAPPPDDGDRPGDKGKPNGDQPAEPGVSARPFRGFAFDDAWSRYLAG